MVSQLWKISSLEEDDTLFGEEIGPHVPDAMRAQDWWTSLLQASWMQRQDANHSVKFQKLPALLSSGSCFLEET